MNAIDDFACWSSIRMQSPTPAAFCPIKLPPCHLGASSLGTTRLGHRGLAHRVAFSGEYDVILKLCRLLNAGKTAKEEV